MRRYAYCPNFVQIKLDMNEFDLIDAEKKAIYQEIKDYVLAHSGLNVSNLYIVRAKQNAVSLNAGTTTS